MKSRKLFCEISPLTYRMSSYKQRVLRIGSDLFTNEVYATRRTSKKLPFRIYSHQSLIRRKLGDVDMRLQENKAVNLSIAAPKVTGILIQPGETFSFWKLVGSIRSQDGYLEGLTISSGKTSRGIGGGLCQFTNLIHWLILHTDMQIIEHHHHDGIDLFPDFGRQIPFGTGTSISHPSLDYRFKNSTDITYQLIVSVDDKYLCGEIRSDRSPRLKHHIKCEMERFTMEEGKVYRNSRIVRESVDRRTGLVVKRDLVKINHAEVKYDPSLLDVEVIG